MSYKTPKIIFNIIGSFLGAIGLLFVLFKIYNYSDTISFKSFPLHFIFVLPVILSFGCFTLALAWRKILLFLDVKISKTLSIKIYGISQISKYVPGNIFQYVGRQSLGVAGGIPGWKLVKSMFIEAILVVCTGAFLGLLFLIKCYSNVNVFYFLILYLVLILLVLFLIYKILKKHLLLGVIFYFIYLLLNGLIFVLIIYTISQSELTLVNIVILLSSYIIAWLIGYVMPGAPAGLGIREIVLIFLLKGLMLEQDIVFCVLISRIVSVFGDIILYIFAFGLKVCMPKKYLNYEKT